MAVRLVLANATDSYLVQSATIRFVPSGALSMSSRFNRRSSSPILSLLTAAILLGGAPVMSASAAEPIPRSHGNYTFNIAQQPLVSALNAFTAVTGWQIGLPAELGQGVSSPGVRGPLSPEKALDQLLVGTNLSYRKLVCVDETVCKLWAAYKSERLKA